MTPSHTYRTALIGLGRIGRSYTHDKRTARHFRYATHAQALAAHPAFSWEAAVDSDPSALEATLAEWCVPYCFRSEKEMVRCYQPEVVVIATPPNARLEMIESLPTLRAVVVEKPLGTDGFAAAELVEHCRNRGIMLQVNFWRRFDRALRELAGGRLRAEIGDVQTAFGLYGNGVRNNGTHLIELIRMLLGEIAEVQALAPPRARSRSPLPNDADFPFSLRLDNGIALSVADLDFSRFREVALDVWGTSGRLEILQEGLIVRLSQVADHRAIEGEREVAADCSDVKSSGAGTALYDLYDNLAGALRGQSELLSPGANALITERVVDALVASARADGARIVMTEFCA